MSKKQIRYRQFKLVKKEKDAISSIVTWLPERVKFIEDGRFKTLKVGNIVELKDFPGDWTVEFMGNNILEDAPDWRAMIKGHRKNTGDSIKRK